MTMMLGFLASASAGLAMDELDSAGEGSCARAVGPMAPSTRDRPMLVKVRIGFIGGSGL